MEITTMERGKDNEERDDSSVVTFAVLRKDIDCLLDFMERSKNEDGIDLNIRKLERLKRALAFVWTFVQLSYFYSDGFTKPLSELLSRYTEPLEHLLDPHFDSDGYDMLIKYDMDHIVARLLENISRIGSQRDLKSSVTLTEEQLVELFDALLMNLHDIPSDFKVDLTYLGTQYDVLQKVCSNLRNFLGLKVNGCIEPEIVGFVLPQVQLMVKRVGHLIVSFCIWDFTDVKLAHLLMKIIPIVLEVMHICSTNLKASKSAEVGCFIKQLLNDFTDIVREYLILQARMGNVITSSTSARNINVMVEFLLIIVTGVSNDFIHQDKFFDLLARVVELTTEVSVLVSQIEENSRNEENANDANCSTLDLLENIELLKRDLRHVYLKVPTSSQLCFSMSDGVLFMNLVLKNLNDLLNSKAYSIVLIEEEIRLVKEHLEFILSFFMNVEQELYKDRWTHALNVAYEMEHAINSILVRDHGLMNLIFFLPRTVDKIKLIKEELFNLSKKTPKNRGPTVVNSPNKPVVKKSPFACKVTVGFEEEREWIIRKLIDGSTEIDVISIIGMAGLGKTTLANKVYGDNFVVSRFDILAWCTVDQERNKRMLLQKILNQVTNLNEELDEDSDVADVLRKKLYGKRYLIVLDDLWDTATWDELTIPFPEVNKGSRIILTTRKQEVALHAKRKSDPLNIRCFEPDESLKLLQKRVFGDERFPSELLDVGKEIAWHCHGLPLVVDLIAGVIATMEKEKTLWLQVLNNLKSFIFGKEEEVLKVIQLSYDHLPDHVKPCLLYLGSYPKDREIKVSELQDLWSAEGLVEQIEMKTTDEVTKGYLDDLISSSLVVIEKSDFMKATCKIHDLVHDFCQVKATDEMFFHLISSNDLSCGPDLMLRRMTIASYPPDFGEKVVSGKYLLSLKVEEKPEYDVDQFLPLRYWRLLKVLKLPSVGERYSSLNEIGLLVHLRYLHLTMRTKVFFPLSLSNIWNLETLVVENGASPMVLLPNIWNLVKLRNVRIRSCTFFDVHSDEPILLLEDSKLENLRELEGLSINQSKDGDDIYTRFPNLRRLKCTISESSDPSPEECNWFPRLDLLNELEELDARFQPVKRSVGADICLPWSLKELVLNGFYLTPGMLSKIAKLPNLEKLTLRLTTFQDQEWNVGEEEDTFRKLKFLGLVDGVKLSNWQVEEESFPVLERLHLRELYGLQEIPSGFGDIISLSLIKLVDCPRLKDSALKMKEEVADMMGNDKLQVVIRSTHAQTSNRRLRMLWAITPDLEAYERLHRKRLDFEQ